MTRPHHECHPTVGKPYTPASQRVADHYSIRLRACSHPPRLRLAMKWKATLEVLYEGDPVPRHERREGESMLAAEHRWMRDMVQALWPGDKVRVTRFAVKRCRPQRSAARP